MIIARYVFLIGFVVFGVPFAVGIYRELSGRSKGMSEGIWKVCAVMLLFCWVCFVCALVGPTVVSNP